ncbi:MAG: hypothetical protein IJ055_10570, partial [Oscillospiraceae bacterium]|nr:hypothetical protein [Oscillospiraceae bacterium]
MRRFAALRGLCPLHPHCGALHALLFAVSIFKWQEVRGKMRRFAALRGLCPLHPHCGALHALLFAVFLFIYYISSLLNAPFSRPASLASCRSFSCLLQQKLQIGIETGTGM